jgi:hypothetical protein
MPRHNNLHSVKHIYEVLFAPKSVNPLPRHSNKKKVSKIPNIMIRVTFKQKIKVFEIPNI